MGLIKTLKKGVQATPIWPLLRPRRIHVYSVGAPKTGTTSIARIFSKSYRAVHEAHIEETIEIARQAVEGTLPRRQLQHALKARDRWGRFECESNALLMYVAGELAHLFPQALFICTIRPPHSWMRSMIDQHINVSTEDRSEPNARSLRPSLYGVLDPSDFPPEEQALADHGVWNIDAYLSCWCHYYGELMESIPEERLLVIETRNISGAIRRIADFVGVPYDDIADAESHANLTSKRSNVLDVVDERYLADKVDSFCKDILSKVYNNYGVCRQ